ncbi:MAG: DNA polymerase III subunit alpha [Acidimicrobiaceae bacterium]|nr:DNA polymerase III subunit alpha [Acidimicrobiaceae bacterium]
MASSFVHLHVHTEYSILDGASRLDELIAAAVADNQPALAITDHGNMYGVLDFYKKCKKNDIRPIIGMEAYMARESCDERPSRQGKIDDSGGNVEGGGKLYYHLTLLAVNNAGYKNLIQIASRAFLEGYYYKPRCDWEILSNHSEGLIATSGCLGGQVPQALLRGNEDEALKRAARFQEIFGRDNFFVEMQDHEIPEQKRINPGLLKIAEKLKAPLLATNDSHYTHRDDAEAHDALLCVQTGSRLDDPKRFKFQGCEHYLKTSVEMREVFKDLPEACNNTLLIAERAEVNIEFGKLQLPDFPIPEDFTDDEEYLRHLTFVGAKERWGENLPEAVVHRLDYELDVINSMGFASYFLIIWDTVTYARNHKIRVGPGRGSAAGCAVAYALRITDLDPIRYDLLFERFLNPDRISMPDIDVDFDSRYRDEIINYTSERYGRDRVAQIITFGTIKARAAVRDAARVLGYPASLGNSISKLMPPLILGRTTPLRYCFEKSEQYREGYNAAADLRKLVENDADVAKVVGVARGLEGLRRQDGIHAAAVVITRDPLTESVPIQRKPDSGAKSEQTPVVTQYEMQGMEDLGLLKMDLLGLRNLDVITDCINLIKVTRDLEVDIDNVNLADEATFKLLRRGDTSGVFQLESAQMRALIRSLQPTDFDDIAALVALYRPGPMAANMHNDYADRKNNRKPVKYVHEDAEEILEPTYGLMIYQENVMRIAQKFAGYSLAEADSLRKAMGKKIRAAMSKEEQKFVSGVADNGYSQQLGEQLFEIIQQFADYAFNKSHSYGYGMIAYQTAYLKANYTVEYFAALLSSVRNSLDSAAVYLNECRRHDIAVTVPDVNTSAADFTPVISVDGKTQGRIVYGLSAIRNLGEIFAGGVITEREANGHYSSFVDFVGRIDLELINKRSFESLILAGGFDSLGYSRKGLLQVCERIVDIIVRQRKEKAAGVMSLFGGDDTKTTFDSMPSISDEEFGRIERLAQEKELLGFYLSDHPLSGFEAYLQARTNVTISDLTEANEGDFRSVGGVITRLKTRYTRKGELMATLWLEDLVGALEVVVFPKCMSVYGSKLADDAVAIVNGKISLDGESLRLYANEIDIATDVDVDESNKTALQQKLLKIWLAPEFHHDNYMKRIKEMFVEHSGEVPVELHLGFSGKVARLSNEYAVNNSQNLRGELESLLGDDAIVSAAG